MGFSTQSLLCIQVERHKKVDAAVLQSMEPGTTCTHCNIPYKRRSNQYSLLPIDAFGFSQVLDFIKKSEQLCVKKY